MPASSMAGYYLPAAILKGWFLKSNDHAFAHGKQEKSSGQGGFYILIFFALSHIV